MFPYVSNGKGAKIENGKSTNTGSLRNISPILTYKHKGPSTSTVFLAVKTKKLRTANKDGGKRDNPYSYKIKVLSRKNVKGRNCTDKLDIPDVIRLGPCKGSRSGIKKAKRKVKRKTKRTKRKGRQTRKR